MSSPLSLDTQEAQDTPEKQPTVLTVPIYQDRGHLPHASLWPVGTVVTRALPRHIILQM